MPDDRSKRGSQDGTHIDVSDAHKLQDWSKKLGVSEDELKAAVHNVGDRTDAVKNYLKSRATTA